MSQSLHLEDPERDICTCIWYCRGHKSVSKKTYQRHASQRGLEATMSADELDRLQTRVMRTVLLTSIQSQYGAEKELGAGQSKRNVEDLSGLTNR
ncbi:hypothetical protein PM082_018329 [Marasmius tenuissimus]|nr:hypothetical protein PM082_018329 [Marasmius tenuissimus]